MMSGTHGPTKELETRTPIEKPLLLRILASEQGALASLSASLLAENTNTTNALVKDGTSSNCETKVVHQKPVTTKKDKASKKPQQQPPQGKKAAGGGTRPEAVPRLHHLYKAAHVVSGKGSGPGGQVGRVLSSHYTGLVLGVAQKSVLRLTPRVKRTICKGCQSLLLPGQVKARLVKQGGAHLQMECRRCTSVKNFPIVKKKRS